MAYGTRSTSPTLMLAALYWALGRPHLPLAYGFFCATYDFLMATYFYTRRNHWRAAWAR